MSGRDAARDELAKVLYRDSQQRDIALRYEDAPHWTFQADAVLAWMDERGYRKVTVTPEQFNSVAKAIRDSYELDTLGPECSPATNIADWLGEARAAARAFGLEVTDDGGQ